MIEMKTFYGLASIVTIISLIGSVWNLCIVWGGISIGAKIAQIAGGVCFNGLLFILFFGLWRITPKMGQSATVIDSPQLESLIKQYQEEKQ